MESKTSEKTNSKKEEKVIHKGIYISNQRRKGPGGRIKCDEFECKIQVSDHNPALHQSQVQWVQIRRYIRGQKREPNTNNSKKRQNDFKKVNKKETPQAKNGQKQQTNTNLVKKFKQKLLITGQIVVKTIDPQQLQEMIKKQPLSETITHNIDGKNQIETKAETHSQSLIFQGNQKENKLSTPSQTEDNTNQISELRNEDQIQTQSDNGQEQKDGSGQIQMTQDKGQVIVPTSTERGVTDKSQQETAKPDIEQGQKQKKQAQEVIVGRIIRETKIVYKQKRFVAILTCQKKKGTKNTFIDKQIKPINKIMQDYFLDVTPIHSRLPKMELDNLVKQNLHVLNDYIQQTYPEKGKQLTRKKLNQILDVVESIYVVASFGVWGGNRPYANIHQVIGKTMTIDGECNCFLFEHHLNDFHYQKVQSQKQNQKQIQLSPTQKHKVFNKMVFSIDPASSVDLDDALSIQKVGEDLFEIGIHISDVSQYLKFIDRSQLIKRTTSVYLPHKVFHMLTTEIMKISSLNPNVQRLAFSIYVKMNVDGQIVGESRLQKNIIMSSFKLSYETVQDIITAKINFEQFLIKHPATSVQNFDILVGKLQDLTRLGLAHRKKRIEFQVFQNRQIHFQLDQNRWPVDISVQSRFTSKKIVEQYMIIGNVQAAKKLIKNFRQNALIIYHPKPSDLAVKNFNQTFKFLQTKFQFQDIHQVQHKFLQIEKDETISEQVKQYMFYKGRRVQETAGYKLYHQAARQILQKSPTKDQSLIKNVHFALGEDFYTHFTSPMRRMADILVHQTLNSLIYGTQPKKISDDQIQKINTGRKHTKRLKKDLTEIYMCLMIHKTGRQIQQDGIITSFGLKSVSIYIPYFDMMREIYWKDELEISRVSKNRQDQEMLDVCIYFDRKFPSRDVIWKVKKYDKVRLIIDSTKRPPLRMSISIQVTSTKGKKQLIYAYNPDV